MPSYCYRIYRKSHEWSGRHEHSTNNVSMVKHQLWLKTLDHVINNRVAPWATTKFKIQNDSMASLEFDDAFWVNHIPDLRKAQPMTRIHLFFSLICFLKVSVLQLLTFTFESDIKAVKDNMADHGGYKFITYVLTILPHILSLQNNSWCPVKICGHQLLFRKLKICGRICRVYAMSL